MMSLDKKTVEYVANLARIELKADEVEKLYRQLHDIIGFIDKLSQLDTQNTKPTSHILPISNVLREDTPKPSLNPEEALNNAPSKKGKFFSVPKVVDN